MKHKTIFISILIAGLLSVPAFSVIYAQVALESSSIKSAGTNSTSSGFILISSIGEIAGFISSTSFQIIAGFLPQTQGGNTIPAGLFPAGVTPTFGSDGQFIISTSGVSQNMDFSKFSTFNGGTDSVTTQRDLEFTDGGLGGTVLIKAGTTITANLDWDGTFAMPENRGVTTVTPPAGTQATQVIRMGLPNIDFTLNQPMRFTFTGKAGQNVASVNSAGTTEITTICDGIVFDAVNAQLVGGLTACKINNNNDLLLWTKTLSDKFTFIALAADGRGGCVDCTPPLFLQGFKEGEYPLVIGNVVYPVLGFYNEKIKTAKLETHTSIPIKLLIFDDRGPGNIQHVALYMNLKESNTEVYKSDTWIVYDKGSPIKINDPHGFIAQASNTVTFRGDKFEIVFDVTFAKPMGKSNLAIVAWDSARNVRSISMLNALEIIETKTTTTPVEKDLFEEPKQQKIGMDPEPGVDIMLSEQKETIQKWTGYHVVSASNSELLEALSIEYDKNKTHLPKWTKTALGKWVLEEKISFKEFREAIKYIAKL